MIRIVFVVVLLAFAGSRAWSQDVPGALAATVDSPYKVGTVDVRFIGPSNVSVQVVRANMQVVPGMALDENMIDHDIRTLYSTGYFEFIDVKRDVRPDRTVNLVFDITPKFRVLSIVFQGNQKVSAHRLEKEISTKSNASLDEWKVKEDCQKIRDYYQKTGYNQIAVTYAIDRNRATGFGTVTFKISEGQRVKIKDILFVGDEHVKPGTLRGVMETKRWWMFSWLTGSGRLKTDEFEDDLGKIKDYYRELGYLDVEVPEESVVYTYPKSGKMIITIRVIEGRQYHVGAITISGNTLIGTPALMAVLKQTSGKIFTPSKIDADITAIEDAYGRQGYINTKVQLVRTPNLVTGNIDVQYNVTESGKFYVQSIKIEGNTKTKSNVILRELALGPGDVFDIVRMKSSKARLENTRYFDEVAMVPAPTGVPGRDDLKINVTEGRTGNLSFGAGFSSLESIVFFTELTQSNFDISNPHSMFQGAGQKFRIRLQLGAKSSEALISWEEPWLFERRLALGFSLYRTSNTYESDYYEDLRTGGEVYLRKRLFGLVDGRVAYNYEVADIRDVTNGYQVVYPPGSTAVSKLDFQLVHDTRDKLTNTTTGDRAEVDADIASKALGGDVDFYKLEAHYSKFFTLSPVQTQVLAIVARAGTMDTYGDTAQIPFFDRYYLGGPYDLRGFKYQDVGPKYGPGVNGNYNLPVGGDSYGMLTLEYSVEIAEPLRFAVFYDAGFVNANAYDFNPSNYNDDVGIGLRLNIMGAPLNLDYGFPLRTDRYNGSNGQFNFSFGTRF